MGLLLFIRVAQPAKKGKFSRGKAVLTDEEMLANDIAAEEAK